MRLIHTSDWHLGHRFHGRARHEEQSRFLDWLAEVIECERIDVLLVAGDVFDTTTPGSRTLTLYYSFLHRLAGSACRHIIITGGNHDSPSLLEAPRELLRTLDIHVVGAADGPPDKEILLLRDRDDRPELVVCAVPFLRDRDIRTAVVGETLEEKERRQREGVIEHYNQICAAAEALRVKTDPELPLIAMGHLFVAGGLTREGDGVRDLAVGGLQRIEGTAFPGAIDYLALGHLHIAQRVNGSNNRRYCGAPLAMTFAEAGEEKSILLLECEGRRIEARPVAAPEFQSIASLAGDLPDLLAGIEQLRATGSDAWLALHYQGEAMVANLREQLQAAVEGSKLAILRIRNSRLYDQALRQSKPAETLEELGVDQVFERCLEINQVEADQRLPLRAAFAEILASLHQAGQAD